jgi:transcriptional regulator of acetoin/glycerol metabolism
MKTLKLILPVFIPAIFIVSSCNKQTDQNKTQETKDTATQKLDPKIEAAFSNVNPEVLPDSVLAPVDFRGKLNEVLLEYIQMKQALTDNDSTQALMKANQIKRTLSNLKNEKLVDKLKEKWGKESDKIEKCCKEVTLTEKIENQRKAFSRLTDIMRDIVKDFGFKNRTIYLIYCDDKNAGYWLADTKDINNPYLGKIPEGEKPCAEVKEAWKFE